MKQRTIDRVVKKTVAKCSREISRRRRQGESFDYGDMFGFAHDYVFDFLPSNCNIERKRDDDQVREAISTVANKLRKKFDLE